MIRFDHFIEYSNRMRKRQSAGDPTRRLTRAYGKRNLFKPSSNNNNNNNDPRLLKKRGLRFNTTVKINNGPRGPIPEYKPNVNANLSLWNSRRSVPPSQVSNKYKPVRLNPNLAKLFGNIHSESDNYPTMIKKIKSLYRISEADRKQLLARAKELYNSNNLTYSTNF